MRRQPHILLIILDTLRRDRLSAYGYRTPGSARETSPALDAFADDAALFERAVTPAQWTIPAHASLFTGVYPSTHRVVEASSRLAADVPTLAEQLRAAGYHTAAFCNNPLVGVLEHGLQRGFDHFFNYAGAAVSRPRDLARSALRRALAARFRRFAQGIQNQFAHNDDLFRLSLHPWITPLWSRYVNFKGHTPNSLADAAAYFRQQRGGERPLFTFINLMGTHLPYRPPQDYLKRFASDLGSAQYGFMNRFNADAARWASPPERPFADWERRALDGFYDAEIAYQDEHLGRMLASLGNLDDTLVIVAADHGEAHGDHGFVGHGFVVYQELVHVPLVIRYPERFPQGARLMANVSTRRLYHTMLDAAGIAGEGAALSLAQALNGHDPEGGMAFAEAFPPETFLNVLRHRQPDAIEHLRLRAVRRGVYLGDHKLTTVNDEVEGLYDVAADPLEARDLSAERRSVTADLQRRLNTFVVGQQASGGGAGAEVSPAVVEHLRALGYIE